MDDDVDIYGDLPSFDASECLKCRDKFKEFAEKNARSEGETESWKNKCETFETEKETILLNTSSLLKTARAEIARKDRIIVELRRELEDLKFKRGVWSRAKANHKEPRNRRKWAEENVNSEESWNRALKPSVVDDRSFVKNIPDEDEADTEQKWEPNRQISTLYGERLKKKIQSERESERKQREEAKLSAPDDPPTFFAPKCDTEEPARIKTLVVDDEPAEAMLSIKREDWEKNGDEQSYSRHQERLGKKFTSEQENERTRRGDRQNFSSETDKPGESIGYDVKLEYPMDDSPRDWSDEAGLWRCKNMKSTSGSVHSSEGEHKSHRSTRRHNDASNSRDERYKDDYRYQNSNHDRRHNSFLDTSHEHRSRRPRDAFIHSEQDRKSRKHQETQHNREIREKRSKSSHRARSKTPDRRNNENNRNDRHRRVEKSRDHDDKYEKRRDDGLSRDRYDSKEFNNKDNYDLRARLERKYDDKFVDRSDRNYDSDGRRRARSRSPTDKSRSKSSGASQNDKREIKRSRSRGRSSNTDNKNKKQSEKKAASLERKIVDDEPERENPRSNNFESSKKTNSAEAGKETRATNEDETREESAEPPADAKTLSVEEKGGESAENSEAAMETLTNLVNQVEAQDKFILMLENDCEMPLSPLTRPEVEPAGSRSFREEKIENIEKFIQDYQCNALGIDETSERNEENEFANSTSSIVDTLSMDIDDLVVDTNSDEGIDKKNDAAGVDEKPEAAEIHEENVAGKNESEDAANHGIMGEAVIDRKLQESSSIEDKIAEREAIDRESRDAADDNRSGELVVDEKMEDGEIDQEPRDSTADKRSEAEEIDAKLKNTADEKTRIAATDRKSEETLFDKNVAIDGESENSGDKVPDVSRSISIEEKIEQVEKCKDGAINTIDKFDRVSLENIDSIDRKSRDICGEIESIVAAKIEGLPEEISLDSTAKGSTVAGKSTAVDVESANSIDEKPENIDARERITATESEKVGDRKLDDISLEKNPKDNLVDGKSIDFETHRKTADILLAEKLGNVEILSKSEELFSTVSPPLPPSSLPPALPPLPPSPPPEEQEPEILGKSCAVGERETEKSLSKQTKNRPRIPCLPIVSLYSRKRRNLVLTDSVSSHTIVKSLKDSTTNGLETDEVKSSKILGTERKIVPNSLEKSESPKPKKIQSENSCRETIFATELKANVIEAPSILSSKLDAAALESSRPEVDSSSVVTSKDRKKSKDELPSASSSSKRKLAAPEAKIAEKSGEETRPKAESKKVEKSKNSDRIKTSKNSISTKTSERGKRSVLKTIATKVPDSESAAGSRKRPLSREKENQSKPAKQAKIMVVTRRRPVQLEDSSTVTTLVSSEHEVPLKESAPQNPAKKKSFMANS